MAKKSKKESSSKKKVKAKAGEIVIPFSKEEEGGGGRVRIPEGDYKVKIVKIKTDTSEKGNAMLIWDFEIAKGQKGAGKTLRDYTTLTPKSLWKVRSILEAAGLDVPKRDIKINKKKLIGEEVGVTVYDDEYENKISSKIGDYIDLETLAGADEDDDEDEEEDEDEEDTDEEEDDDDEEDDDEDDDDEELEDMDEL